MSEKLEGKKPKKPKKPELKIVGGQDAPSSPPEEPKQDDPNELLGVLRRIHISRRSSENPNAKEPYTSDSESRSMPAKESEGEE